ncbi:MAG: hypothetical protein ABW201_13270 [Candidatus Thiodiazotropha sp.]
MNRYLIWVAKAVILMQLLLLIACGGGGGGSSSDDGDTTGTTYTISGTITGLTGSGLVLQNNGGDDLSPNSDGSFSFTVELSDGSIYAVTIATQPADQSCAVANGSGTVAAADVTNITITCTDNTGFFSIGGSVSGLAGDGLVLQNNGSDDLSITAGGAFSFATQLEDGSAYTVTIATQPTGQTCTVVNGSGTLDGATVTDVQISCPPDADLTASVSVAGPKLLRFSWNDVGVDHYRLLYNPDGISGFSQVGDNITATTVDAVIPVHLTDWVNTSYMVQACSASEDCADSTPVTAFSLILDAIGYLKPSFIGSEDQFGSSVAISGDGSTLAIGAPEEDSTATGIGGDPVVDTETATSSGAVYLFSRDGDSWSQQTYIKASNADAGDKFGSAVSLSDDGQTLAVGALFEDSAASGIDGNQADNSLSRSGAVYVFSLSGSEWTQQAYIKASAPVSGANFGKRVSLSSSGARLAVSGGGVFVFDQGGSGWTQQAILEVVSGEGPDEFGAALELSGNGSTLAIGAPGEDSSATGINGDQTNNAARGAGAAYVFAYDGASWTQQAYLKASATDSGDEFGNDVSISADGNTLAVGVWKEDSLAFGVNGSFSNNNSENSGAAYLFERQSNVWTQTAYFKASNADPNDGFGNKVALSGDGNSLAVSAAFEDSVGRGVNRNQADDSATSPPGAVYMFTRGDTGWFQHSYVKASNTDAGWSQPGCSFCPELNDEFGDSLSISSDGTTLVVGAPFENSGDSANQEDDTSPYAGAVYLY